MGPSPAELAANRLTALSLMQALMSLDREHIALLQPTPDDDLPGLYLAAAATAVALVRVIATSRGVSTDEVIQHLRVLTLQAGVDDAGTTP